MKTTDVTEFDAAWVADCFDAWADAGVEVAIIDPKRGPARPVTITEVERVDDLIVLTRRPVGTGRPTVYACGPRERVVIRITEPLAA